MVCVKGKNISLGDYETPELASSVAEAFRKKRDDEFYHNPNEKEKQT